MKTTLFLLFAIALPYAFNHGMMRTLCANYESYTVQERDEMKLTPNTCKGF